VDWFEWRYLPQVNRFDSKKLEYNASIILDEIPIIETQMAKRAEPSSFP
jgi:hypothetical protein